MSRLARISLGSNLGDRASILEESLARLGKVEGIEVQAVSRFLETKPVGGPPGQSPFLNAAAALATELDPSQLFRELKRVELEFGRERLVRWGARTLDLDLLLFEELEVKTEELEVPHPRMAFRPFVVNPLAEIAPVAIEPLTGLTVEELRLNLTSRPRALTIVGDRGTTDRMEDTVRDRFAAIGWGITRVPARGTFLVVIPNNAAELDHVASRRWERVRSAVASIEAWVKPPAPVFWFDPGHPDQSVGDLLAMCSGISEE